MSTQLLAILTGLGLADLMPRFYAEGIDDDLLRELTDIDLQLIGVSRLGDRKRLLKQLACAPTSAELALAGAIVSEIGVEEVGVHDPHDAAGEALELKLPGGEPIRFSFCPPGIFHMGSPNEEPKRCEDEVPVRVQFKTGFWIAQTPVTQSQFAAVVRENPSHFRGETLPVDSVSWGDAQNFVNMVSDSAEIPKGFHLELPTEAQWEYACRAGTQSVFGFGDSLTSVEANFDGNHHYPSNAKKGPYLGKTTPVCKYRPNAWGIFDMHGNVWEWCKDWYGDTRLGGVDPQGPSFGVNRVRRGGAWNGGAAFCRAAFRYYRSPEYRSNHFGFRVVLVARK